MNSQYNNTKSKLLDLYGCPSVRSFFNRQTYYEIGEIQKMIIEDMEKGLKDEPVQNATNDEIDWIVDNLRSVESNLILNNINEHVLSYLTSLFLFIANWNINTVKNSRIKDKIQELSNLCDMHITLRDIIKINKVILNALQKYKEYKPVAYETARHFEKKIIEKIKDGNMLNERSERD